MRMFSTLLALLLIAAGAIWFLLGDDGSSVDLEALNIEAVGVDVVRSLPTTTELETGEVARLVPAPLDAPPVEERLPESYRRALGGITGRVVEEDGSPVVDINVALVGADYYRIMQPMTFAGETVEAELDPILGEVRTDEDGRFLMQELETRVGGGLIVDPGGPRTTIAILDQTPSTGETLDIGDITLIGGVTIRGRVVDALGEPIAGARVRSLPSSLPIFPEEVVDFRLDGGILVDTQDADLGVFTFTAPRQLASLERLLPIPTTQTDADGEWEMVGLPSGMPMILYDDGEHVGRAQKLSPTGPPGSVVELGDVPLEDGVTLVGRVVDQRGDPIPGAEVMGGNRLTLGPVAIMKAPVLADDQGRFSVRGLRPSQAHAAARRNEHEDFIASPIVQAGAEEAEVRLLSGRRLTLSLRDPAGEAITEVIARGRLLPDDDADEVPDFFLRPKSLEGRHRVDEDDRVVFDDMQSGYWDISFRVDGYSLHREVFDLTLSDITDTLELQPELGIDVSVISAVDGEPVEHALVVARQKGDDRDFGDRAVAGARTDREGKARLGHLVEGPLTLEVSHPALAVIRESFEVPADADVILELPEGGMIAGQVFEAGAAPSEPVMVALDQDSNIELTELPRTTVTDLEGRFSFSNVQPGEATLEVRERIGKLSVTAPWEAFINSPLASSDVLIESGEETEVVLVMGTGAEGMDTATIAGRLMVNGRTQAGWTVRTWGQLRRSTQTEADGTFDLGLVAAGSVQLMLSAPGQSMMNGAGPTHIESLEVEVNASEWVEIAFDTAGARGIVRDGNTGLPMRGVAVRARKVAASSGGWWGNRQGAAISDADGFFEMYDIQTGEYQLEAEAEGYSRAVSEPFSLRPGDMPSIDLTLSTGLMVQGVLELQGLEDAEPPRWLWLTASTEDGREAAARPSKDGEFRFDDMSEGEWTFSLLSSYEQEFEPITLRIAQSTDNLALVFPALVPEIEESDILEVGLSTNDG